MPSAPAAGPAARAHQPGQPSQGLPGLPAGLTRWLRWGWRQLTSMRNALVLLFLLAVASVPGSVLPQNGIDPAGVQMYITSHPALGPLLNRLSLFDVFAAPWFAAIYLLLFTSLAGCVLPRVLRLLRSARAQPPAAPRHPARLPSGIGYHTAQPPAEALATAAQLLARRRFRVRSGDGWVSAEKGYLHEAGNLLFHLALLALLAAVGLGAMSGYKANRLLVEGDSFADTVSSLDAYHPGRLVSPGDLAPFTITLDRFHASYIGSGPLRGQPAGFAAAIRYTAQPGGRAHPFDLQVNHPLGVDGAKVYLIGHGYAPVFKVTDQTGQVVFDQPVPFLVYDKRNFGSQGVVKVAGARPAQLGFAGVFLPTAVDVGGRLASAFPAPLAPAVSLVSYAGNLGLDSGIPQSVYALNIAGMRRLPVRPRPLTPGQSLRLPGGRGVLTFTGYRQWISLAITYDPGRLPALASGIAAIAGLLLSFLVRHRRIFLRAHTADPDDVPAGARTTVELGGLTRSDSSGGFGDEFATLAAQLMSAHGARHPRRGPCRP